MDIEPESDLLKLEIAHVLLIDVVGYSKLLRERADRRLANAESDRARNAAFP